MNVAALARAIRQGQDLPAQVPQAIALVRKEPLAGGYQGELLHALLRVPDGYFEKAPADRKALAAVVEQVRALAARPLPLTELLAETFGKLAPPMLLEGAGAKPLTLPWHRVFVLGAARDCDVVAKNLAPFHAQIRPTKRGFELVAGNGVCTVNKRRVLSRILQNGDAVQLGELGLRVRVGA